jgi:hypothetical protein
MLMNRLVDWCGVNSLELNVGKYKSITFLRPRHPVEFSNVLWGIMLDRVNYNTDLEVVMDSRMSFSRHIDVTVGKALAMLGFVKRLSGEFRDLYILRALYVLLVRPMLEYASCVWRPFYDMHIKRIERVQRYTLLGLE